MVTRTQNSQGCQAAENLTSAAICKDLQQVHSFYVSDAAGGICLLRGRSRCSLSLRKFGITGKGNRMNLQNLKSILDKILENPKVDEALRASRAGESIHIDKIVQRLLKILGFLGLGVAFVGGRAARKIEAVIAVIAILVELSLLFKRHVVDDPTVQRLIAEAWEELAHQSSTLYSLARRLVDKLNGSFRKKAELTVEP